MNRRNRLREFTEYPRPWFLHSGNLAPGTQVTFIYSHPPRGVFIFRLEHPDSQKALAVKLSSLSLCCDAGRELLVLRALASRPASVTCIPAVYTLDTKPTRWAHQFTVSHDALGGGQIAVIVRDFYKHTVKEYLFAYPTERLNVAAVVARQLLNLMKTTRLAICHGDLHSGNIFIVGGNTPEEAYNIYIWDLGKMTFHDDISIAMECVALDIKVFLAHKSV